MVDLNLYPDASKVEWTYSTLGPGDCIFIPSGKHPLMFLSTSSYLTMLFNNTMNFMFTLKIGTLVLCFCLNDHLNLVKRLFNHAFSLRSVEKNNNHQRKQCWRKLSVFSFHDIPSVCTSYETTFPFKITLLSIFNW